MKKPNDKWTCGNCGMIWEDDAEHGWRGLSADPEADGFVPGTAFNATRCTCGAPRPSNRPNPNDFTHVGSAPPIDDWTCGSCRTHWWENDAAEWKGRTPQGRILRGVGADRAQRCTCGAPRPAIPSLIEEDAPVEKPAEREDPTVPKTPASKELPKTEEPVVQVTVGVRASYAPYLVYELAQRPIVGMQIKDPRRKA